MNASDLQRVKQLFLAASELPQDRRVAYLDGELVPDGAVRDRVLRQLARLDHDSEELPGPDIDHFAEANPETIGTYRVVDRIAEGGMGIVYRAEQTEPVRRIVAIKVIKPGMDSRALLSRFAAERQTLGAMDHPGIAKVFDAGADEMGRPYFVMELVDGVPITEYCDRERLDPLARLQLFVSVCRAVQHAHQRGVLHRDLKPGNVLVTLVDGEPQPKIIDFGVAKAIDQGQDQRTLQTQLGLIIGTLGYMSPEQADPGTKDIDVRSDVYSLGVLLYELLSGELPFDAEIVGDQGFGEFLRVLREIDPARPSLRVSKSTRAASLHAQSRRLEPRALAHRLRGDLDWITLRALHKERERRYESAGALADELERYLHHKPVAAGPPTVRYRLAKYVRRHRAAVAATTLVSLSLLGATGVSLAFALDARHQASEADRERKDADLARDAADEARKDAERVTEFLTGSLGYFNTDVSQDPSLTASDFLALVAQSAATELADQPAVEAAVQAAIGGTLWTRGELVQAKERLRRALELCDADPDVTHEQLIGVLWPYAWVTYQFGEPLAGSLWTRALVCAAELAGAEDPDLARRLHGLLAWSQSGPSGLPFSEGALAEIFTRADAEWPAGDARWVALGDALLGAGESSARIRSAEVGIPFLEAALATYGRSDRAALHESHTRLGLAREELLQVLHETGEYRRAEVVALEAIAALAPALPEGHWYPDVFHAWLGSSLVRQSGREEEAEEHLQKGCNTLLRVIGAHGPLCATPLVDLIDTLASRGQEQQARPLRAALAQGLARMTSSGGWGLAHVTAALGPDHEHVLAELTAVETFRRHPGVEQDPEMARPSVEALITTCNSRFALDDPQRGAIAYYLSGWAMNHGLYNGSPALLRAIFEWTSATREACHSPGLPNDLWGLALMHQILGDLEAAESAGIAALDAMFLHESGPAEIARQQVSLGRSEFRLGRVEEGLRRIEGAYGAMIQGFGPGSLQTRVAFEALLKSYHEADPPRTADLVSLASERLRQLEYSELPLNLNFAAWCIVREPGVDPAAYELALRGAREASTVQPDVWAWQNTLGAAELRCGHHEEAVDRFLGCQQMLREAGAPASPMDAGFLVLACARLGRSDEAQKAFEDMNALAGDVSQAADPDLVALLAEVEQELGNGRE